MIFGHCFHLLFLFFLSFFLFLDPLRGNWSFFVALGEKLLLIITKQGKYFYLFFEFVQTHHKYVENQPIYKGKIFKIQRKFWDFCFSFFGHVNNFFRYFKARGCIAEVLPVQMTPILPYFNSVLCHMSSLTYDIFCHLCHMSAMTYDI